MRMSIGIFVRGELMGVTSFGEGEEELERRRLVALPPKARCKGDPDEAGL